MRLIHTDFLKFEIIIKLLASLFKNSGLSYLEFQLRVCVHTCLRLHTQNQRKFFTVRRCRLLFSTSILLLALPHCHVSIYLAYSFVSESPAPSAIGNQTAIHN